MKSLFKRTIAAASSSVLVLSQIATLAANVNVSAADAAPLNIDKKFVLDVPVDEKDPLKSGQFSDWNDEAESLILAVGEKTVTASTAKAKETARKYANKAASKYGHISSAEIDEILAGIADTATIEMDGKGGYKVTATCANVGPTIGKMAEDELARRGHPSIDANDQPRELDWSSFKASGSLIVEGKFDFAKKSFSYETTLIDENGTAYKGDKGIEEYATKKALEAYDLVCSQRRDGKAEITTERLADAKKYVTDKLGVVRAIADAIAKVSVSGTDVDKVYTDYVAAVEDAAKTVVAAKYVDKAAAKFDEKKPETVKAALTDEKVNDFYDIFVENANTALDGKATINFATADAVAILDEGYDFDIKINGYSGEASFKIADDQADELLAAVKALNKDPKTYADAGYVVELEDGSVPTFSDEYEYAYKEIVSEKKVSAKADTEYGVKGTLSYDVERIIKKIILTQTKKTTETTTSTTPSTESTTSTTPTTESTVSTKPTTESTTSTTPSTESTTSTTPATSVSFEFKGIEDQGLVYWSEEDGTFDLSKLSITLHFFEKGKDTGKTADVTNAFAPTATKSSDLTLEAGTGLSATPIFFTLKDAAAVQKAVTEAGYDQALIDQEELKEGKQAGRFTVFLVLRGDADLNGEVDVIDAQFALIYYTETIVTNNSAKKVLAEDPTFLKNKNDKKEAYFPFSHYAMDVVGSSDLKGDDVNFNDGIITVEDAQQILNYYTVFVVTEKTGDWGHEEVIGRKITVKDELHASPCELDPYATDYKGFDRTIAE